MAGASEPGIGVLYARDKIEALSDARRNGAPEDVIKSETLAVALAHHLVSAYTSLVAVDVTPTAPAGVTPVTSALPGNLPEGLSYDAIFGMPQTATPARLEMLIGALLLATALLAYARLLHRRGRLPFEPDTLRALRAAVTATRRTC
jgi:Ca-activated chloride channel family protein